MKSKKPSQTAVLVLAGVWLTACDTKTCHLVGESTARYTEAALKAIGSPLVWMLRKAWIRRVARLLERMALPGITSHFAARKAVIRGLVREVQPNRLIVLGAGLDGLAYEFSDTLEAIEVDVSATLALKRQILRSLPDRGAKSVPADLQTEMPSLVLRGPGTTVVAEGLTMYLDERAVGRILDVSKSFADVCILTAMEVGPNGRASFGKTQKKVDGILRRIQEQFNWGIDPVELAGFLDRYGWRLVNLFGAPLEGVQVTVVEGMIRGEWVAMAARNPDTVSDGLT